MIPATYHVATL